MQVPEHHLNQHRQIPVRHPVHDTIQVLSLILLLPDPDIGQTVKLPFLREPFLPPVTADMDFRLYLTL